jgi:hypothetical protein
VYNKEGNLWGWHHAAHNHLMTLIVNLMLGAASAQERPHIQGVPGYTDPLRTDLEKKNDREIDRAYRSTVKGTNVEKKKSDPWADVRSAPPAAAKNKQ